MSCWMHAFGEDSGSEITIFATSSFSKSSLFVTDQPNRRTAAFFNSFGVVWMEILGANLVEGGGWAVSKPNFLHSTTEKNKESCKESHGKKTEQSAFYHAVGPIFDVKKDFYRSYCRAKKDYSHSVCPPKNNGPFVP